MESADRSVEMSTAARLADRNVELRTFLLRLLHPEDLGHAVTPEVRRLVGEILRIGGDR